MVILIIINKTLKICHNCRCVTPAATRFIELFDTPVGQPWVNPRKEKFLKKTEPLMLRGQIHLLSLLTRLVYQYA